jgi:hypothetical protein
MLYFPQLATGALAQFPLQRRLTRRTIVNQAFDGTMVKLDDPSAAGISWDLSYVGLTEAERQEIETLFRDTEGRLRSFTFLDPAGNLLSWSEDLSKAVWRKDGAVQVVSDVADPNGTSRAVRITNSAQVEQGVEQKADVPGWFHYCFSVRARAAANTQITLSISNAAGTISSVQRVTNEWAPCWCSGKIDGNAEDLACRLAVNAGASIEAFGFQLEAQPNPADYQRTYGQSGVFRSSRFLEDELEFVANGIDDHAVGMRVFSRLGDQT